MQEIKEHEIYTLLEGKYARVGLDYVLLLGAEETGGLETHRKAVLEAFEILNRRFAEYDYSIALEADKMAASLSSMEELLQLPPEACYGKAKGSRTLSAPVLLPYWFAFLEPPQGNAYLKEDFVEFNNILFPAKEDMEVYRWNDAFSNYFDAGREWWGTGLWTAFNKKSRLMVVIGASLTD